MASKKVNVYLLTLPKGKINSPVEAIVSKELGVEFLNPLDLGEKWQKVSFVKTERKQSHKKDLELLDETLGFYQPKVFMAGLQDFRMKGTRKDVREALEQKDDILELAKDLSEYQYLKLALKESRNKKNLAKVVEVEKKVEAEMHKLSSELTSALGTEDRSTIESLKTDLEKLGVEKEALDLKKPEKILERITKDRERFKKIGVNPDVLSKDIRLKLVSLHSAFEIEDNLGKAKKYIFSTSPDAKVNFAFVAVSKKDSKKLERILDQEGVAFESVDWSSEIVSWNSKGGLQAFQNIAEGLGTIGSKEYDPTILVAIFFMLFFAFCLGDALYGIIIALFTGYFLFFKKLKSGIRDFFNLFFYSSLATLIFGMLTRSWGGNLFSQYEKTFPGVGEFLNSISLIDLGLDTSEAAEKAASAPVNDILPMTGSFSNPIVIMLLVSAAIGFVHITIGMVLSVLNAKKEGDKKGLIENLNWLLFVLSGVGYLAVSSALPDYSTVALGIFGVIAIGLFIFNKGKTIVSKFFGGLIKIYDLISVAADTISYTRLVATGLTSSIIGIVVNMLANNMFKAGGIMIILGFAILIVGHLFNLAVAAFGAYINPLRLHYVEFMPKFYRGKGRKLESQVSGLKYLEIINN